MKAFEVRLIVLSSLIFLEAESFWMLYGSEVTTTNPSMEFETTTEYRSYVANLEQEPEKEYSPGFNRESSTNEDGDKKPYARESGLSRDFDKKEHIGEREVERNRFGFNGVADNQNKDSFFNRNKYSDNDYSATKRISDHYSRPPRPFPFNSRDSDYQKGGTHNRNLYGSNRQCPTHCVPKTSDYEGSGEGFTSSIQQLSHLPQLMNDGDIVSSGYPRPASSEHEKQPFDRQRGIENDYTANSMSPNRRGEKKSCACPCVCPPSNCREERKDERDDLDSRFHQNRPQLPEPQTDLPTPVEIGVVATPEPHEPEVVTDAPPPTEEPFEIITSSEEGSITTVGMIDEKTENAAQSAPKTELTKSAVAAIWVCGILSVILVVVGIVAIRALFIKKAMSKRHEVPEKPDGSTCYYQPYYM